jgi:hypothetical protein
MTKTELQVALAEATQTNKKAAGAFLNALAALAYKTVKKMFSGLQLEFWVKLLTWERAVKRFAV